MNRLAIKEAGNSNHSRYKMGATIVKGGRTLSVASNRVNRGCKYIHEKRWDNTLHAEAHAVLKLLKKNRTCDLDGADIYVVRVNKVGHLLPSRPCAFCMDLLRLVGIKRVFYTVKEGL